jgi:hypothetical protein
MIVTNHVTEKTNKLITMHSKVQNSKESKLRLKLQRLML